MPFVNLSFAVPDRVMTDSFMLRPIVDADTELDYEAVMESREFLRLWEQSTWPEDDFTVESNREDVAMMEQRHAEGKAFTYTVMNPSETECLGCVYVFATNARMYTDADITPVGNSQWSDYEATVHFWVRQSQLEKLRDRELLEVLRTWFAQSWGFEGLLFITNEQFVQQVDMIEQSDLRRRFDIKEPHKPGRFFAYA